MGILAVLVLVGVGCSSYPTPEDIESMYVKEGQGLGHRFIGEAAASYYVGIGDGVIIMVAGAPEISGPYIVGMDGKITLPFVEDIYVGGLTRKEIADKVKNTLERYYREVEVTVTVAAFNSKRFYVFGEALRVGALPYTGDVTMIDVLSMVGTNPITAKWDVLLIRSDPVKPRIYVCHSHEVLYRGLSRTNYQIREDDIIYVRANIWGKLAQFVAKVTYPIQVLVGAIWLGTSIYSLPLQIDIQQEYLRNAQRY
jgi:hypothetical protein